ncbi:MAG: hypothetical protein RL685_7543 [Pseudomonadota bacterium]|jgi:hypothetical protein
MRHVARVDGSILTESEFFEIRSEGRVVRCSVRVPTRTPPAAGAAAGRDMCDWLIQNALPPRRGWLGVIVDTRNGPSVLGPVTRSAAERLVQAAETAKRPLAVLVSTSAVALLEQFSSVSRSCGPTCSTVTTDPDAAIGWMSRLIR